MVHFLDKSKFLLRTRTYVLLLVIVGLILFFNSIFNDFIGDDEDQVLDNPMVHSIKNIPNLFTGSTYYRVETQEIHGIYYRPLMMSSYAFLYSVFGPNPSIFHLFQLLIHIVNAVLVFFVFKHFLKEGVSFMGALIFLVHPINSETVLQIANLQDTLFLFFGLSAFLLVTKLDQLRWNLGYQLIIVLLLLLSLFSKESGVLFIALILIYLLMFNRKKFNSLLLLSLTSTSIYIVFRSIIAQANFGAYSFAPIVHAEFLERLINIPKIVFIYLSTFLLPINLVTNQVWIVESLTLNDFYLPLIFVTSFFAIIFIISRNIYLKDRKLFVVYAFFTGWFILGLALHIQIIPLDITLAERWFYFPSIGILGLILASINNLKLKKVSLLMFIFLLVLLSGRTFARSFDWRDPYTLYTTDLKASPDNYFLANNLGFLYIRDGKFDQAKPYIESSVQKRPYFGNLNNLAIIYAQEKNYQMAKKSLEQAIQVGANYTVYENYANFLFRLTQEYAAAEQFAKMSLEKYPSSSKLWLVLARSQFSQGKKEEALISAKKAYELDPTEKNKKNYEYMQSNILYLE